MEQPLDIIASMMARDNHISALMPNTICISMADYWPINLRYVTFNTLYISVLVCKN